MKYILIIVCLFLAWRIFLFLPLLYAQSNIPSQLNSKQYTIWAYVRPYPPVSSFLLYPWSNFDGVHYLTIAGSGGYPQSLEYQQASDGRFFPFYPMLIAITTFLLGKATVFDSKVFFSAFFLSNVFFLLSLIILFYLICLDFSRKIALLTIIFLLCFPVSFFFGATYSESLYLFLTVSVFYALRKKLFLVAAMCSFFLVITRVVGILIIPIVLFEMWKDDFTTHFKLKKKIPISQLIGKILFSILIPLGFVGFSLFSWYFWKDPFFFIHAQQRVGDGRSLGIVLFPQTVFRYIKILLSVHYFSFPWNLSILELSSFLFAFIFLYIAFQKSVQKSYVLFSALMFLIASQTGSFSGLPRYVMVFFPIFLGLALTKKPILHVIYIVISLLSLFFLTAFFSKGYFIS